jgi:hypothetical protein
MVQDNDLQADSMWTVMPENENTVQIPSGPNPLHNNTLDSKDGLDGISATSYDDDQANGHPFLDVRIYVRGEGGKYYPTRQGLAPPPGSARIHIQTHKRAVRQRKATSKKSAQSCYFCVYYGPS